MTRDDWITWGILTAAACTLSFAAGIGLPFIAEPNGIPAWYLIVPAIVLIGALYSAAWFKSPAPGMTTSRHHW